MKRVVILGSTGSIGTQVFDVCEKNHKTIQIVGLSAFSNVNKLIEQMNKVNPRYVCIYEEKAARQLKKVVGQNTIVFHGMLGLLELVNVVEADTVVVGIPGSIGLKPILAAIDSQKNIINANKESVAIAGDIIMSKIREKNVSYIPLDGEHIAIHQCLKGEKNEDIRRVILTASGGAFREIKNHKTLSNVTYQDALKHPTWSMGNKITIDCATLMNKGLEIIEAHYIFNIPYEKLSVLIHKESIVHSMVELIDGSVIAQLSVNDMRLAALYALTYPIRTEGHYNFLDLISVKHLTFEEPRIDLFPCLRLAIQAGIDGGIMPTILNASNEVSVEAFLRGRIKFYDISTVVETMLEKGEQISKPTLEDILETDSVTRAGAIELIDKLRKI
jgi:1-deoxy-D-xylulose-5-phosphate reductoisomerase